MNKTNDFQKNVFLCDEADNYFNRNKEKLEKRGIPEYYKFYEKYIKAENKILEVGCSCGSNLKYFKDKIGCMCYGIDPSKQAIQYGKNIYPELNLSVGTADFLDFKDDFFDFIFFGHCLYLVDRKLLSTVVGETDRVLKDNGMIGITDFYVKIPQKRKYKHYEGIFAYKMDYAKLFLAYPHFFSVDKMSNFTEMDNYDAQNFVSSDVLFKNLSNAYICID